jgi:hypothetical protein
MSDTYTIVRKFHGSWPEWFASLDNKRIVYVRIRRGAMWIGEGDSEDDASDNAEIVHSNMKKFAGICDSVDALTELRRAGYYFVADIE